MENCEQKETLMSQVEDLNKALELIEEAQYLVDNAMEHHEDREHYKAYGRYGFDQLLGYGNPYDATIMNLIEATERKMASCEKPSPYQS